MVNKSLVKIEASSLRIEWSNKITPNSNIYDIKRNQSKNYPVKINHLAV